MGTMGDKKKVKRLKQYNTWDKGEDERTGEWGDGANGTPMREIASGMENTNKGIYAGAMGNYAGEKGQQQ